MIKQFDYVEVLVDKDFICPKRSVKKGSTGIVTDILEDEKGNVGYLVEIKNEIYDFIGTEIRTIK